MAALAGRYPTELEMRIGDRRVLYVPRLANNEATQLLHFPKAISSNNNAGMTPSPTADPRSRDAVNLAGKQDLRTCVAMRGGRGQPKLDTYLLPSVAGPQTGPSFHIHGPLAHCRLCTLE